MSQIRERLTLTDDKDTIEGIWPSHGEAIGSYFRTALKDTTRYTEDIQTECPKPIFIDITNTEDVQTVLAHRVFWACQATLKWLSAGEGSVPETKFTSNISQYSEPPEELLVLLTATLGADESLRRFRGRVSKSRTG